MRVNASREHDVHRFLLQQSEKEEGFSFGGTEIGSCFNRIRPGINVCLENVIFPGRYPAARRATASCVTNFHENTNSRKKPGAPRNSTAPAIPRDVDFIPVSPRRANMHPRIPKTFPTERIPE